MLSSFVLGPMEAYCCQAAFKGTKSKISWGGLPIVILVGDNHQLPLIQEGAFYCLELRTKRSPNPFEEHFILQNGMELFKEFGKDDMTLAQRKRVLEGQIQL